MFVMSHQCFLMVLTIFERVTIHLRFVNTYLFGSNDMIVIGDIYLGKLFISFYYFLGKQAQKSNILCLINAAESKFTVIFTPEEMNDLSILGGGGEGSRNYF